MAKADSFAPNAVASRSGNPADAIAISPANADVLGKYRAIAIRGIHTPAQHPVWIEGWVEATAPQAFVATFSENRHPVFAIALEVVKTGPCHTARLLGGRHANGNFAPVDPSWLAAAGEKPFRALPAAIARSLPGVDILALERLAPAHGGCPNPLLALPHTRSPNISLAVDLSGGFEQYMARPNGKRKRKKHRSDERKFEAAGGFRRYEAGSESEVKALLDAFFEMKAARFRKAGIPNVFAEPEVQNFFRRLFTKSLSHSPKPFSLQGLEVGGSLRAMTASSRTSDRLICEFGAIADDEPSNASPGEFLFYENIRETAEQGLPLYDFSVGDEPYKRGWCDIETVHYDVIVPLSMKGRLYAAWLRMLATLKLGVKNSPMIWRFAKAIRRRTLGQSEGKPSVESD
ncbi:GNAT family N-acetyltransferase [Pseudaminobacter soli (ex Zhang et al. 2022)]|nr:GNAT family N-acetyltransferase [Pseudaminobacter soli]